MVYLVNYKIKEEEIRRKGDKNNILLKEFILKLIFNIIEVQYFLNEVIQEKKYLNIVKFYKKSIFNIILYFKINCFLKSSENFNHYKHNT